jgi:hypothetical protein
MPGLVQRRETGNRSATVAERVWSAVLALVAVAPLVVASRLTPDAAGHGTHTQLGLPACGWLVAYGHPCPTCGMTTAFAWAAGGRLDRAVAAQPAGAVLAVVAAGVFWVGAHTAVTGSRAAPAVLAGVTARHAFGLVGLIACGWVWMLVR